MKLKCLYAGTVVPFPQGNRAALTIMREIPTSLVPRKGQSVLISNGINNPHYDDSVSVHRSHILLAMEEDV